MSNEMECPHESIEAEADAFGNDVCMDCGEVFVYDADEG